MLVASDEATSGSVMQNDDRMRASSSGSSHSLCWAGVPNSASSSMLPVSGAAQFRAAGARRMLRPVNSASGAYCRLLSPAPFAPGRNRFQSPRARADARSRATTAGSLHCSGFAASSAASSASAGYTSVSRKSVSTAISSAVRSSWAKSMGSACLIQVREPPPRKRGDERADLLESRSDRLPAAEAQVDALEDHRQLVRRKRPVPAQWRHVGADDGLIHVDQLVERGIPGHGVHGAPPDAGPSGDLVEVPVHAEGAEV